MAAQHAAAATEGENRMREIVVDTETTGLDPAQGHRIVEIAALELMHHVPTGRKFHCYVNPERDMPADAYAVHGLSAEFLARHPTIGAVIDDLLAFVGDDPLVIHNAEFDIGFLNAELALLGRPALTLPLVDTLSMARKRFPGAPASLDALCRRFTIDLAVRDKHGAEIDCGLLAAVYVELLGGRQPGLDFAVAQTAADAALTGGVQNRPVRPPRPHRASEAELLAHRALLATIAAPMWNSAG
jgi:DNA polymerase III subunit epsilon